MLRSGFSKDSGSHVPYMLFDVVHVNGQSLADVPLSERKAWLADLLDAHPHPLLRYSDHQIGNGAAAFKQAVAGGLEGVVSKRVDSVYSGSRSGARIKSKRRMSDEFIVAGFTEPKGSRTGLGALFLAIPSADGLRCVGRVGTGFSSDQLLELRGSLEKLVVPTPSVAPELMAVKDRKLAIWVKPELVVEVFYQGIGGQGPLLQPAFKALRSDKKPADVSAKAGEKNRKDRIFIDWLRNGRGSTSVASYSLRARDSAGVAMPLAWTDLKKIDSGDAINARNAIDWIKKRANDPWGEIDEVAQEMPRF